MANDLVVQLGAKLDQFSSDMDKAGDIADSAVSRIEQAFANINPTAGGFASLGIAATGVTGIVGTLLASLTKVNSELAELQKNAEYTGLTTDRFQQIQYAAGQGGVSSEDSINDLRKVASLLSDAKENENSLTRLLDANNIKYKDRNGEVISLNQLLTIAGGLLNRFDSMPEKTKAAQMLGLSQNWVEALRNGSKAFEDIAQSADATGAVIDGATVAKAAAFDRAWKQSAAQLAAQFKSVSADIGGWLDDLIDKSNDLLTKTLAAQGIQSGSGQEKFDAWADALDILRKDMQGATQDGDQVARVIDRMKNSGKGDPDIIAGLELVEAKARLAAQMLQSVAEQQSKINFPNGVPTPTYRPASANNSNPNAAKLPKSGGDTKDEYDRAQESVEKYTARVQALADTEGLGAAATEEMKAQAQLLTAAQQAGIPITDKVRDRIQDLAQDAGDAAAALAKAKVTADTVFSTKTAFLTPQDLAIAQQLKGIYGNDIPAALKSTEAAGLRAADALKQISQLGQDVNKGFLVDFETQIRNGASAMDALKTAGVNALGKIADKLAGMAADQLWANAFGGTSSAGLLGKLFGLGGASSASTGLSLTGTGGLFDAGGYTGQGGKYVAAGIVHKGEYVFDQDSVRAAGGPAVLEQLRKRLRGYADGGYVGMPSIPSVSTPASSAMTVHAGSTVVIQGDASEKTVGLIKAALAQHDATLPMKVVSAVKDAKARRVLA